MTSTELDSPAPVPVTWGDLWHRISVKTRAHWRTLAVYGLVGMVAGAASAFFIAPKFKSSATFQPAIGQPIQTELAINNPDFFGDLLVSDTVLRRVSHTTFPWHGASVALATIYEYEELPPERREDLTRRRLRSAISWDVSPRTGVVEFTVSAGAPDLAKALADTLLAAVNEVSVTLRKERGAAERRFWAERIADARKDVDDAERLLSTYYQRNPATSRSAAPRLDESRLSRAVELAQQVYIETRMREAMVAAQEARSTNALTVLRDPVSPARPSHPRRPVAALAGLVIGLSLGLSRLVLRR